MASGRKLHIPVTAYNGFVQLLAIQGEQLQQLEQALSLATPSLDRSDFVSSIASKLQLDKKDATELIRVLMSLYATRESSKISTPAFINLICEALASTEEENLIPVDSDWEAFKEKLARLLQFSQSIGISAKAAFRFSRFTHLDFPVKPDIEKSHTDRQRYERETGIAVMTPLEIIDAHPLAPLAGKYYDEPLWDDFMKAIKEYRQEVDEQEDTAE